MTTTEGEEQPLTQQIESSPIHVVVVPSQTPLEYPMNDEEVPLQVMNGSNPQPPSKIQLAQNNIRVSQPGNPGETNMDKLPPHYEEIINGSYDKKLNDGMGLLAACGGHKRSWILLMSIIITFLITGTIVFYLSKAVFETLFSALLCCGSVAIVACVMYHDDWCGSSSKQYLDNIHDASWTYNEIKRLQQCTPIIRWHIECYHWKGEKEEVTHRANMDYTFNAWRDLSIELTGLTEWKLTKLTPYKQFVFANNATKQDYEIKSENFKRQNDRDRKQKFSYEMILDNFKSKILVEAIPGSKHSCLNSMCFALFSFFLCSPCYRTWFSSHTGKKHYIIQKEISI